MDQLSYRRHRCPPPIIHHALWLYLRFALSYRDVEELLAARGLEVSYETVRRWVLKFGPRVCQKASTVPPTPERSLAPRRDGGSHRRQTDVPMARRGSRGQGSRYAGAAATSVRHSG